MSNLAYLDNLQAYNTYYGNIQSLDLLRQLGEAGTDYYYKGFGVPNGLPNDIDNLPRTRLNPLETYEVQISIPPGTIVTQVSVYSEQSQGFSLQIIDPTSGVNIWNTQDIRSHLLGNFTGVDTDVPAGPSIVKFPWFVLKRGMLTVVLRNLSTSANLVQVYLECAVPNTKEDTNRQTIGA